MYMELSPTERAMLDRIVRMVSERSESYETGVQTSVCWKTTTGWSNVLTKVDFVRKGEKLPAALKHDYRDIVITRRLLPHNEFGIFLDQLLVENRLETGQSLGSLAVQGRLSIGGRTRWSHSEWSLWPADVFTFEPLSGQSWPPDEPLIALDEPYYPSFEHVLSDFFAIRSQGWTNYLRGQVVMVLPDFRARISKLTIALASLRAELECVFLQPADLVLKIYAESPIGRLAQRTIQLESSFVELDLIDKPSLVSLALVSRVTGETLDQKAFREGMSWREPDVLVEISQPEIEQFLLTGESETVEFKEKLDKSRPEKIAKTAAAFGNTKGGTIVFGVDDNHNVVGCEIKGMSDTITNIIRSYCDPPPVFTVRAVNREGKELLLVEIAESPSTVHFVKDLGLFIRANGTNRAPTNHEFQLLLGRRGSAEILFPHFS